MEDQGAPVSETATPLLLLALRGHCESVSMAAGETLRIKGLHYDSMYLIEEGEAEARLSPDAAPIVVGAGKPIGEIAFVRGLPATAAVVARTPLTALRIDDATLSGLEASQPELAVALLRWLGAVGERRSRENLGLSGGIGLSGDTDEVTVLYCRDEAMLLEAQQLRYEVYCGELGRSSPYADDARRVIADPLDETADCFIAKIGDEITGTLRLNRGAVGGLGILEQLYGMTNSPLHPEHTVVCTKFIVKSAHRRGPTAMKLIADTFEFARANGIEECYIDCIPALAHYYRAMGFELTGEPFFHVENGTSYPMKLDVPRYAGRLRGKLTLRRKLGIYLRAKAIKWWDRLTGRSLSAKPPAAAPGATP